MKRIVILATLLAMVIGSASMASAADITATGSWSIFGLWSDGNTLNENANNLDENAQEDDFEVVQRVRQQFNFTANENLTGALYLEIGTATWGTGAADLGADNVAIEVKNAYINWVWPNTDVTFTAGIMGLALPSGLAGSAVLDDDLGAFVMNAPLTENIGLMAGWARPFSNVAQNGAGDTDGTYGDVIFAAVPLTFDGVSATPYFARLYTGQQLVNAAGANTFANLLPTNATAGNDSDGGVEAWWGGLVFNMTMFDPIVIDASFVYGNADGAIEDADRSGWLADLAVTYTGFDSVTPRLFFAYSTGEDGNSSDDADSERLPTISGDYSFGTTFFSSAGFAKDQGMQDMAAQLGYWTLGLELADISFLEGLSHEITVLYAQGTNDADFAKDFAGDINGNLLTFGRTLTDEDSIWEFSLENKYQIYDELTATLAFSYISADLDEATWEATGNNVEDTDAGRMALGVEYKF